MRKHVKTTRGAASEPAGEMLFIDEHVLSSRASVTQVWQELTSQLESWDTPASTIYARLTGASPRRRAGAFPQHGSALPGFCVNDVDPPVRLELMGRHHFSRYSLVFVLESQGKKTLIRARSDAEFPGFLGSLYRVAVVRSGAHRFVTRRLLKTVARDATAHF